MTVYEKYSDILCNVENTEPNREKQKLTKQFLIVRMYKDQLKVFDIYKEAGIKSKSELFRLLIDSHKVLRIMLKYSDSNFILKNQDEWENADFNYFFDFLEKFNEFEKLLENFGN